MLMPARLENDLSSDVVYSDATAVTKQWAYLMPERPRTPTYQWLVQAALDVAALSIGPQR